MCNIKIKSKLMKSNHIKLLLLAVFFICKAFTCTKTADCHSFSVEISYDRIEDLSVQPKGGTAPIKYNWSHGLGGATTVIAPGPGTYSVTATDFNKCMAIAQYEIQ